MTFSWCFSSGGNVDLLDVLPQKKFYSIDHRWMKMIFSSKLFNDTMSSSAAAAASSNWSHALCYKMLYRFSCNFTAAIYYCILQTSMHILIHVLEPTIGPLSSKAKMHRHKSVCLQKKILKERVCWGAKNFVTRNLHFKLFVKCKFQCFWRE